MDLKLDIQMRLPPLLLPKESSLTIMTRLQKPFQAFPLESERPS